MRSWRGLVAEIMVIVIGVLIALAAGNVAEDLNWQRKVANGERQLLRERNTNMAYAAEQAVVGPCLDAQLVILRNRVLASGSTLEPAPLYREADFAEYVFRLPTRPYADGIWQALNNDGTSVHMAGDRQQMRAGLYEQIASLRVLRAESDLMVGRLMAMAHPLPLDASTRALQIAAIEEQRARSRLQSLIAGQLLGAYRDLDPAQSENAIKSTLRGSGTVAFCRKQGLPMDDWREIMAAQEPSLPED